MLDFKLINVTEKGPLEFFPVPLYEMPGCMVHEAVTKDYWPVLPSSCLTAFSSLYLLLILFSLSLSLSLVFSPSSKSCFLQHLGSDYNAGDIFQINNVLPFSPIIFIISGVFRSLEDIHRRHRPDALTWRPVCAYHVWCPLGRPTRICSWLPGWQVNDLARLDVLFWKRKKRTSHERHIVLITGNSIVCSTDCSAKQQRKKWIKAPPY